MDLLILSGSVFLAVIVGLFTFGRADTKKD
jgi:hypothetical protein